MTEEQNPLQQKKEWYAEGLRFKCTGCGQCCTGAPGYIWITDKEIEEIADYLEISLEAFSQKYLRRVEGRWSLREDYKTFDCVFLKDKKCRVYPVRPKQCRTFPWWPYTLNSKEAWEEAATHCEGINHPDATLVTLKTIQTQLDEQLSED